MNRVSTLLMSLLTTSFLMGAASQAQAYRVFVSNEKENTVSVIDSEKLEVIKTIKVGQRPRGIILTHDG